MGMPRHEDRDGLLRETLQAATEFLATLSSRPVTAAAATKSAAQTAAAAGPTLPEEGLGAVEALRHFRTTYEGKLSASAGPRYLGFVVGGTTPAALAGDWMTAAYDQNVSHAAGSAAAEVERETIALLRSLFGLPATFSGVFVTGATMANVVGLGTARQWAAQQAGVDVAELGVAAAPAPVILAGTPHASVGKALAILGMGRASLTPMPCLPGREAIDTRPLELRLQGLKGKTAIVIAAAGTVNTTDFDDLERVAALCRLYGAWLHVDGAFGLFAAASPRYADLVRGVQHADSIATDAHKWLNVPYDSGIALTRHRGLQQQVFKAMASYLEPGDDPLHLTPENSRRFRALSAWMTLTAYGRSGYRQIVETSCELAGQLGAALEASGLFTLVRPVNLNVVCFRLNDAAPPVMRAFLNQANQSGATFLTATEVFGLPAVRAAFSGWSTTAADVETVATALIAAAHAARAAANAK